MWSSCRAQLFLLDWLTTEIWPCHLVCFTSAAVAQELRAAAAVAQIMHHATSGNWRKVGPACLPECLPCLPACPHARTPAWFDERPGGWAAGRVRGWKGGWASGG
jgi:hypothetical protein